MLLNNTESSYYNNIFPSSVHVDQKQSSSQARDNEMNNLYHNEISLYSPPELYKSSNTLQHLNFQVFKSRRSVVTKIRKTKKPQSQCTVKRKTAVTGGNIKEY